jgi:hypothetical protein
MSYQESKRLKIAVIGIGRLGKNHALHVRFLSTHRLVTQGADVSESIARFVDA